MPLPKFDPLLQFRAPYNYELAGKHYQFVMDDGNEYYVNFLDEENLQWVENKNPYVRKRYECLKGEKDLYFVHIIISEEKGKEVHYSLILDLAQDLVTLVITEEGKLEEAERLIKVTPVFGAIQHLNKALPEKRHAFTDRMAGRRIIWQYSSGFNKMHIYYKPTLYRLPKVDTESFRRRMEALWTVLTARQKLIHLQRNLVSTLRSTTISICSVSVKRTRRWQIRKKLSAEAASSCCRIWTA